MYIFAYNILGMSYEEDEESIDDEEMDDSSPDRQIFAINYVKNRFGQYIVIEASIVISNIE